MSDLFPRMVEEAVDYGALEESIRSSCLKLGLEDVDGKQYIKQKIINGSLTLLFILLRVRQEGHPVV